MQPQHILGMPQRGRGRGGVRYEYGRYTGGVRYVLVTREPTVTRETTDATDGVGGVAPEFTQSDGRRLQGPADGPILSLTQMGRYGIRS